MTEIAVRLIGGPVDGWETSVNAAAPVVIVPWAGRSGAYLHTLYYRRGSPAEIDAATGRMLYSFESRKDIRGRPLT